MSEKTWSEAIIGNILNECGGNWKFIEMFKPDGSDNAQSKRYDPDGWAAYPDYEKSESDKILLLVEVKGYSDFFNHVQDVVAMKYYQYSQYFVVQKHEMAEVRVVFVIRKNGKNLFFWETLDRISDMESWFENVKIKDRKQREKIIKHIFWNTDEFRTDIENLGL